jgi:hypothetical protein
MGQVNLPADVSFHSCKSAVIRTGVPAAAEMPANLHPSRAESRYQAERVPTSCTFAGFPAELISFLLETCTSASFHDRHR